MKIVLLNAPPRAGKNTSASLLQAAFPNCGVIGFSHHLKRMVHGIYMGHRGWLLDPDHYDAVKEIPNPNFDGLTPRQAYVHYSENVIKPLHGDEWFGEKFCQTVNDTKYDMIAVPDSGFRKEAERAVREFGADNMLLIHLYKAGCSYAGDSRGYINLDDLGVPRFEIDNAHGARWWLEDQLKSIVDQWLK